MSRTNHILKHILTLAVLALIVSGCDAVRDNLDECARLVRLHLQYKDRVSATADMYTKLSATPQVRIYAFRKDGSRVSIPELDALANGTHKLTKDTYFDLTLTEYGEFTFVALTSEDFSKYDIPTPKTLNDLIASVAGQTSEGLNLSELYFGDNGTPYDNTAREVPGGFTDTLNIQVRDMLHTIHFTGTGLVAGDNYTISVVTPKNNLTAKGGRSDKKVSYTGTFTPDTDGKGVIDLDIMRIEPNDVKGATLVIKDKNGAVIIELDFEEVKTKTIAKGAKFDLNERDIFVELILSTNGALKVNVNGWNIVSRNVDLGNNRK